MSFSCNYDKLLAATYHNYMFMPYKSNDDLPPKIKNVLPEHAQDIYRATFNHAWEEYKIPSKRKTLESQEQVAHKVAWAAVKKKFTKVNEEWQLKK